MHTHMPLDTIAAYLAGHEGGGAEARWNALVPAYQQLAAGIS